MSNKIDRIDIHKIYADYLKAMKIPEEGMGPTQRIERKRAFIAGFMMGMKSILNSAPDEEATEETFREFTEYVSDIHEQIRKFAEDSVKEQEELMKDMLN